MEWGISYGFLESFQFWYETIADFAKKEQANLSGLRESVASSTYKPQPYKQVLIPTVRDRIVQQALLNAIFSLVKR